MSLNEKYKTGVLWQDIQHKELIHTIKKMSAPTIQNSAVSSYTQTSAFLVMYAHHHFNLEEGYMEEYEYPDLEFHKKAHREFIIELKKFRKKFPTYSLKAVDVLKTNLQSWILNHIYGNDKKLGAFIVEKERKKI